MWAGKEGKGGKNKRGKPRYSKEGSQPRMGTEGSGDCGIRQRKAMYQNQAGTALSAVEACYYFIFDRSPSIRSLR